MITMNLMIEILMAAMITYPFQWAKTSKVYDFITCKSARYENGLVVEVDNCLRYKDGVALPITGSEAIKQINQWRTAKTT